MFSFYVTQNLSTGEGGMVVTNKKAIKELRTMSLHGMDKDAWKGMANLGLSTTILLKLVLNLICRIFMQV